MSKGNDMIMKSNKLNYRSALKAPLSTKERVVNCLPDLAEGVT
jgi:hypothetical protein